MTARAPPPRIRPGSIPRSSPPKLSTCCSARPVSRREPSWAVALGSQCIEAARIGPTPLGGWRICDDHSLGNFTRSLTFTNECGRSPSNTWPKASTSAISSCTGAAANSTSPRRRAAIGSEGPRDTKSWTYHRCRCKRHDPAGVRLEPARCKAGAYCGTQRGGPQWRRKSPSVGQKNTARRAQFESRRAA